MSCEGDAPATQEVDINALVRTEAGYLQQTHPVHADRKPTQTGVYAELARLMYADECKLKMRSSFYHFPWKTVGL